MMFFPKASHQSAPFHRLPSLAKASTNDEPSHAWPNVVGEIMTPLENALVVDARMDVEALTTLLLERGLNCVAVKSPHGTIVGFVSMADLVRERRMNGDTEDERPTRAFSKRARREVGGWGFHITKRPRATVKSIMMPFLLSLPGDSPIERAAALMAFEGVHRLLVLSPRYDVVGIVTAFDVLRCQARRVGYVIPEHTQIAWRHQCECVT
jgi:CBS-domain-containing membrane protein